MRSGWGCGLVSRVDDKDDPKGIRLDAVTPADESAAELLVDALDAPPGARVGETIDLVVRLRSRLGLSP